MTEDPRAADPALLAGWLRARSLARGLPLPVAEGDGWRIETGSPEEVRRYVFAGPSPTLRALADEIATPRIFLKLCAASERLRDHLTPAWRIVEPTNHVMTIDREPDRVVPLPPGYRLHRATRGPVIAVRITDDTGLLAASGFAAEAMDVFAYDRIVTDAGHRRRGLGRAVMTALGTAWRPGTRQMLVATNDGRRLYETMGWRVVGPYSTAVIPSSPA